jgi:hypothetical protein
MNDLPAALHDGRPISGAGRDSEAAKALIITEVFGRLPSAFGFASHAAAV